MTHQMEKIKRKQKHGFGSFGEMKLSMLEGTVIAAFFPEGRDMTIKELIERTDHSYERVNSALKYLTEQKIVKEDKKGKTLVYSLDLQNLYSRIEFGSYMLERKIDFIKRYKALYGAIKEIIDNSLTEMVVLFGSYSKGIETRRSDVDILCLSHKKKETELFVKSLRYKYDSEFAPIVLPSHEFSKIKKENPELWNDLKLYGIAFKGDDLFYHWMYEDEQD